MIIRKSKRKRFTSLSNQLLQDRNLSFEVRGMLGYLLSKPDDWQCRMADIEREGGIKSTARRTMMKAAEAAGYLTFERTRNAKGQFESAYTIHEEPVAEDERTRSWEMAIQPDADEPPPDGPGVDNPAMEEPRADGAGDIEKNEVQQKTDIQKTDQKPKAAADSRHPAIQLFRKLTNRYPKKALMPEIIRALGDNPNEDLLTRCHLEWVKHGWNEMNLAWLFDWYSKGEPQQKGNGYAKTSNGTITDHAAIVASFKPANRIGG